MLANPAGVVSVQWLTWNAYSAGDKNNSQRQSSAQTTHGTVD